MTHQTTPRRRFRRFLAGATVTLGVLGVAAQATAQPPTPPPISVPGCDGPQAISGSILYALNGVPQDDNGAVPGGNPLPLAAVLATAVPGDMIGVTWTPGTDPACAGQIITLAFHGSPQPVFVLNAIQPFIGGASTGVAGGTLTVQVPDTIDPDQCFLQGDLVTGPPLQPDINAAEGRVYNAATFAIPGGVDRLLDKGYAGDPTCTEVQQPPEDTTTTTAPVEDTTTTTAPPPSTTAPSTTVVTVIDLPNCEQLGRVNIPAGDPQYHQGLDSDNDGIGCEEDAVTTTSPIRLVEVGGGLPVTGAQTAGQVQLAFTLAGLGAVLLIALALRDARDNRARRNTSD